MIAVLIAATCCETRPQPPETHTMETRPKILIADDHVVFAEGLRLLLEKHYAVVGTVADGRALIAEARRLKPDVILVDIGMPLLNGLDAAKRVCEHIQK